MGSSVSNFQGKYDVFISIKGADTGDNFASHLNDALHAKGIETFINNDPGRGEEITLANLKVIDESKVAVIIFSQQYGSSPRCLDELVHIMECRRAHGKIVLPIFYRVDPSHVEEQTRHFGHAFHGLEEQYEGKMPKINKWRAALKDAACVSGWDSFVTRLDARLVKEIVEDMLQILKPTSTGN